MVWPVACPLIYRQTKKQKQRKPFWSSFLQPIIKERSKNTCKFGFTLQNLFMKASPGPYAFLSWLSLEIWCKDFILSEVCRLTSSGSSLLTWSSHLPPSWPELVCWWGPQICPSVELLHPHIVSASPAPSEHEICPIDSLCLLMLSAHFCT